MNEQATHQGSISSLIVEGMRNKGLNVEKLSQVTGISERFISFLVEEQFEHLPPMPYVRGYIMKIAAILQIDENHLWEEFKRVYPSMRRSGRKDLIPPNRFAPARFNATLIISILCVLLIALYILFRFFFFSGKPSLELFQIQDTMTLILSVKEW